MQEKSVFELILSGEIDSEYIYEDKEIFAINDINPLKNNITKTVIALLTIITPFLLVHLHDMSFLLRDQTRQL